MKRILLLGATGSIGLQTVDVIEQHPDQFCLVGIAAGHQADVMQKSLINIHRFKWLVFPMFQKLKNYMVLKFIVEKMPWWIVLKIVNMIY